MSGKLPECQCRWWQRILVGHIWGYPNGESDPWIPRCRRCHGLRSG